MKRLVYSLLSGALLLAACGGSSTSGNPKNTLTEALKSLAEAPGISLTATLQSDVDSLVALSEGDLSPEDAQKILDSSLTIAGRQVEDIKDSASVITADIAGIDNAVELRAVGDALYARADLRGLLQTFGQDPGQLDAFAAQAAGSGLDFLNAAVNGDWIGIQGLSQFLGPQAEQATGAQQELIDQFVATLEANSEVSSEGSDDVGEHLNVAVPLRETYEELRGTLSKLGAPSGSLVPAGEVPEGNLVLDVWVDDGNIRQIEADFLAIASEFEVDPPPEGVEDFRLRVAIEEFDGSVEAPADSTPVDPQKLMEMFFGGMAAGSGAVAPADICDSVKPAIKGAPQEVVDELEAQFGSQCPELFK